jgi:hypothetical protein
VYGLPLSLISVSLLPEEAVVDFAEDFSFATTTFLALFFFAGAAVLELRGFVVTVLVFRLPPLPLFVLAQSHKYRLAHDTIIRNFRKFQVAN